METSKGKCTSFEREKNLPLGGLTVEVVEGEEPGGRWCEERGEGNTK